MDKVKNISEISYADLISINKHNATAKRKYRGYKHGDIAPISYNFGCTRKIKLTEHDYAKFSVTATGTHSTACANLASQGKIPQPPHPLVDEWMTGRLLEGLSVSRVYTMIALKSLFPNTSFPLKDHSSPGSRYIPTKEHIRYLKHKIKLGSLLHEKELQGLTLTIEKLRMENCILYSDMGYCSCNSVKNYD